MEGRGGGWERAAGGGRAPQFNRNGHTRHIWRATAILSGLRKESCSRLGSAILRIGISASQRVFPPIVARGKSKGDRNGFLSGGKPRETLVGSAWRAEREEGNERIPLSRRKESREVRRSRSRSYPQELRRAPPPRPSPSLGNPTVSSPPRGAPPFDQLATTSHMLLLRAANSEGSPLGRLSRFSELRVASGVVVRAITGATIESRLGEDSTSRTLSSSFSLGHGQQQAGNTTARSAQQQRRQQQQQQQQHQQRPDGDARNGVEESYAGGETNQGLTNDGDWSRRSSDTQRARARDKLPHTPGLRWIVARPSVRYQPPSAHATGTSRDVARFTP
ncbi:hypothetical protein KM043_009621 [Ampulex compressa]|nr:hypothetical protein KM043_009621 [Ampulex compressa]